MRNVLLGFIQRNFNPNWDTEQAPFPAGNLRVDIGGTYTVRVDPDAALGAAALSIPTTATQQTPALPVTHALPMDGNGDIPPQPAPSRSQVSRDKPKNLEAVRVVARARQLDSKVPAVRELAEKLQQLDCETFVNRQHDVTVFSAQAVALQEQIDDAHDKIGGYLALMNDIGIQYVEAERNFNRMASPVGVTVTSGHALTARVRLAAPTETECGAGLDEWMTPIQYMRALGAGARVARKCGLQRLDAPMETELGGTAFSSD
ncbi:hypothetical protein [Paraburkholderia sediminicola]|uniref:hypothetical protein n=1 Tax=Paraburkholderia sediminicola TaxID=458836 RepID=UPI0038BBD9E7